MIKKKKIEWMEITPQPRDFWFRHWMESLQKEDSAEQFRMEYEGTFCNCPQCKDNK